MADNINFLEKDLFAPICTFLNENGYEVHAEVNGCDIVAVNEFETVIVELKKSFNLKLVYQAIDRQEFSDIVYVAIGRSQKGMRDKNFKSMLKLLKRLNIGLITVAMDSPIKTVDVIIEPEYCNGKNIRKRKRLKNEISGRSQNLNEGGSNKTKIMTAYREKSIEILCLTAQMGTITSKELKELGYEYKTLSILYKNYYGWFIKSGKAEYTLSEKGKNALSEKEYSRFIDIYSEKAEALIKSVFSIVSKKDY